MCAGEEMVKLECSRVVRLELPECCPMPVRLSADRGTSPQRNAPQRNAPQRAAPTTPGALPPLRTIHTASPSSTPATPVAPAVADAPHVDLNASDGDVVLEWTAFALEERARAWAHRDGDGGVAAWFAGLTGQALVDVKKSTATRAPRP
jgi:hypothetical protein